MSQARGDDQEQNIPVVVADEQEPAPDEVQQLPVTGEEQPVAGENIPAPAAEQQAEPPVQLEATDEVQERRSVKQRSRRASEFKDFRGKRSKPASDVRVNQVVTSDERTIPYKSTHPFRLESRRTKGSAASGHRGYPRRAVASLYVYEASSAFAAFLLLTILKLYLMSELGFSDSSSTSFMHAISLLTFLAIPIWSMVGDMVVSRYKLLLSCCLLYFIGSVLVNFSTGFDVILPRHLPIWVRIFFVVLGVTLMAAASGGRSALIAQFAGEQFVSIHKEEERERFFDIFYILLNCCIIVATLGAPLLRDIHCFGNHYCYPLVIGLSGIAAFLLLASFFIGSPAFLKTGALGRTDAISAIGCWITAVRNRLRAGKSAGYETLLDHALLSGYTRDEIKETRVFFGTLKLLFPFPIYWALYEMSNTRWVDIGLRMNSTMPFVNYSVRADALRWINPVLIFLLVPVSALCLTPLADRCTQLCSEKVQICMGFVFMILTYVAITVIASYVDSDSPPQITSHHFNFRLMGGQDGGPVNLYLTGPGLRKPAMRVIYSSEVVTWPELHSNSEYDLSLDETGYDVILTLFGTSGKGYTGVLTGTVGDFQVKMFQLHDQVAKAPGNRPMIRGVRVAEEAGNVIELLPQGSMEVAASIYLPPPDIAVSEYLAEVDIRTYDMRVDGIVTGSHKFFSGGVYSIFVKGTSEAPVTLVVATTPPSRVHILWLILPISLLTISEFLASPTALSFFYSEVPHELRADALRCWFLAMAPGHLIVMIVAGNIFKKLWLEMLFYTILMSITTLLLMVILWRYKSFEQRLQNAFGTPYSSVIVQRSSQAVIPLASDRPIRRSSQRSAAAAAAKDAQ